MAMGKRVSISASVGSPKQTIELDQMSTEFFLKVGKKSYRISIVGDDNLGFSLVNGVDMKVTNPPAFHGSSPFVQITQRYSD